MNKVSLLLSFVLLISGNIANSQSPEQQTEQMRGGWIADINNKRHILYIVIRDNALTGSYCFDCDQPANLAIIDDGVINTEELQFSLYHYPASTSPYIEYVHAEIMNGELRLEIQRDNFPSRSVTLHRTPAEEIVPAVFPEFRGNLPALENEQQLPGPEEQLSPEKIAGLWLWGTGPSKQHFIFKAHKGGLRGMVCGPCDRATDTAILGGITLQGTKLHFEIQHEDNGAPFKLHGPHSNIIDAVISKNELHLSIVPSYEDPSSFTPGAMTLLGPIVR